MSKLYNILPRIIALLMLVVLTTAMGSTSNAIESAEKPVSQTPTEIERALGNPESPVTVIEYASLTCGHCARFHTTIFPELKRDFIDTNKIHFIYRDYPLDMMALNVAHALRCLPAERFFGALSFIYEQQSNWLHPQGNLDAVKEFFKQAGMTPEAFDACLSNKAIEEAILQKQVDGQQQYKVSATPTIIVNDEVVRVADYETLKAAVEKALAP